MSWSRCFSVGVVNTGNTALEGNQHGEFAASQAQSVHRQVAVAAFHKRLNF